MAQSIIKKYLKNLFGTVDFIAYGYNGEATLDTILNSFSNSGTPIIGVDHSGEITGINAGNRQFILAWQNGTRMYCWAMILSFNGIWYARRSGGSTYSITKLGGGNKRVTTPCIMHRQAA